MDINGHFGNHARDTIYRRHAQKLSLPCNRRASMYYNAMPLWIESDMCPCAYRQRSLYGVARLFVRKQDSQFELTVFVFIYIRPGVVVAECVCVCGVRHFLSSRLRHHAANGKQQLACPSKSKTFSIFAKHRQPDNRWTLKRFSMLLCSTFSGCPVIFADERSCPCCL